MRDAFFRHARQALEPALRCWVATCALFCTAGGARGAIQAGSSLNAGIVDVAAGGSHTLALSADGILWGTGSNGSGQLADGSFTSRNSFAPVATGVVRVAGGFGATLFIKADRTLWMAGYNQGGAFGGTDFSNFPNPVQIASDVVDVAAAQNHSLVLKSDGSLWSLGGNYYGEKGDTGDRAAELFFVANDVKAIAAADTYGLFVKADGTLWGMGNSGSGQLGGDGSAYYSPPRLVSVNVQEVRCGSYFTVFIKTDGSAWGLGYNSSNQLTNAGRSGSNFTAVQLATGVRRVATGSSHTLLLKTDMTTWGTGANSSGQIGNGSFTQVNVPVQVLGSVVKVAAAGTHSLFLRADGSLHAAGANHSGQLGDGTNSTRSTPVQVLAASLVAPSAPVNVATASSSAGLVRVTCDPALGTTRYELWRATSSDSATAVRLGESELPLFFDTTAVAGSTYYYWVRAVNGAGGSALAGGIAATPTALIPYLLSAPENVHASVGATATFSILVAANPAPTYRWQLKVVGGEWVDLADGAGVSGSGTSSVQISLSDTSLHNAQVRCVVANGAGSFTTPAAILRVAIGGAQMADGTAHSLMLRQDGSLWATGSNAYGEHGGTQQRSPRSFTWIDDNIARVCAGYFASFFVRTDATLWSVGENFSSYLGSSNAGSATRTLAQLSSNVADVAMGRAHSLILYRTGELYALGSNFYGQRGDASSATTAEPVWVASGVMAVAAGEYHSLFVKADGSLWAMGRNTSSQLGDGTLVDRKTPVMVAHGVTGVAAGTDYSLFLKNNGELWGMGNNSSGQLGLGSGAGTEQFATPRLVTTSVVAFAAGSRTAYLIKADGTLWRAGAYTNSSNFSSYAYTFEQLDTGVISVTAGDGFAHWIKVDGSVWAYQSNTYGQLGDGTVTTRPTPVQVHSGASIAPVTPANLTANSSVPGYVALTWDHVPGAAWYSVLRSTTGDPETAVVIADRLSGPLYWDVEAVAGTLHHYWVRATSAGGSARSTAVAATPVMGNASVVQQPANVLAPLNSQASFSVVAVANMAVTCRWQYLPFGASEWLDLTNDGRIAGATTSSLTWAGLTMAEHRGRVRAVVTTSAGTVYSQPATLRLQLAAIGVAAGSEHSLFLLGDGSLWATGSNHWGQFGVVGSSKATARTFVRDNVTSISAGFHRTFFIDAEGILWGVGLNGYGVLGMGTDSTQPVPVQIAAGVSQISAGNNAHAVFIKRDGTLWGMGLNNYGQLGDGTTTQRWQPILMASGVLQASAGGTHTLFVRQDRTLWAVGGNTAGQLGDGTTTTRPLPVQVASGVIAVAAGNMHSLFIKEDGSLWAMGANNSGQLGDGTTTDRRTPVQVATDVVSCAAAGWASYFVKSDGTVWSVGNGQTNTPVQIATDGAAVSIHSWHLLLLMRDGTVRATGSNTNGQLGDGTTTTRTVLVEALTGAPNPVQPPMGLAMGAPSTSAATITWAPAAAAGFEVWRGTEANLANATRLPGHWNGAHFIDPSATPGVPHYYWVRAVAPDGSSAASAPVTAYIGIAPATVVSPDTAAVSEGGSVTFQANASGYPAPTFQWRQNQTPIPGATLAYLTISPVLSETAGDYDVIVSNAVGSATSSAVTLTIVSGDFGFSGWRNDHFSPEELAVQIVSGASADPDRDGLPNLLEYALGTDPRAAATGAPFTIQSEEGFWTFTYRLADSATNVACQVERSSNLVDWTTGGVTEEVVSSESGFTTWRARVSQTGNPVCFFRLRVAVLP